MDRRAWWAIVHGVVKSRTRLGDSLSHTHTHTHTLYTWWAIVHGVIKSRTRLGDSLTHTHTHTHVVYILVYKVLLTAPHPGPSYTLSLLMPLICTEAKMNTRSILPSFCQREALTCTPPFSCHTTLAIYTGAQCDSRHGPCCCRHGTASLGTSTQDPRNSYT